METALKQLAWLVGASYGVGLITTGLNQAIGGYPGLGVEAWFDVRQVIFGGLMLLLVFVTRLAALAIWIHEPIKRARERHPRPITWRARMVRAPLFLWAVWAELGNRIFGHTIILAVLVTAMVELEFPDLTIGLLLAVILVFVTWLGAKSGLENKSPDNADERVAALLLNLDATAHPPFRTALWLVIPAVAFGFGYYSFTSQSLGGGRPIPVRVQVDDQRGAPRFADGRRIDDAAVDLLPSPRGLLLLRSRENRREFVLLTQDQVVAVRTTSAP